VNQVALTGLVLLGRGATADLKETMMKIETGHPITGDVKLVEATGVRFVTDEGRCLFEVACMEDGHSIEITANDMCKVDGVIYDRVITVRPRYSNQIIVGLVPYE
jgi:hypothetical protein